MNKHRKKVTTELFSKLVDIRDTLEMVLEEEEEAKENFPENLRNSERYEAMEETYFNLQEAFNDIENAVDLLGSIE